MHQERIYANCYFYCNPKFVCLHAAGLKIPDSYPLPADVFTTLLIQAIVYFTPSPPPPSQQYTMSKRRNIKGERERQRAREREGGREDVMSKMGLEARGLCDMWPG